MKAAFFLLSAMLVVAAPAIAADLHPAALVGVYDGGQMEIASGLELTKDGQFRYGLSYGALDEAAAGTWSVDGGTVTLAVEQYESNDPDSDGTFGPSVLKMEEGALTLPRHGRVLRFRKQER